MDSYKDWRLELVDCQGNNKLLLRVEGLGCALVTVSTDCVASKEE